MKNKMITSLVKRVVAAGLAVAVVMAGVIVKTDKVEAAGAVAVQTEVVYVPASELETATYDPWVQVNRDHFDDAVGIDDLEEPIAPTKPGYFFGGWYKDANGTTPITKDENDIADGTDMWAKFVPAYVFSVKAQIGLIGDSEQLTAESAETRLRLISTIDDVNYRAVGFDVFFGSGTTNYGEWMTRVYSAVDAGIKDSSSYIYYEPVDAFGDESVKFVVQRIDGVKAQNYAARVYARPYVCTMDGTIVHGLGKYVHVEDALKKYISVGVNLCAEDAIAAGLVEVQYPSNMTLATDATKGAVEKGHLFPAEWDYAAYETDKLVRIVGNAADVTIDNPNVEADNGIFINLRFNAPTDYELGSMFFNFNVTEEDFCNVAETDVDLREAIWDIKY